MIKRHSITRRGFIKSSAAATALSMTASSYARIFGSNARLNVAFIGVGGIAANQHVPILQELGAGCTCYADADSNRWEAAQSRWSDAKGYTDYRKMWDNHRDEIDAVMVGTPDHQHYPATILPMMEGKHVYTQKPLTHTVWEARQLMLAKKKYKVATQMGNQLHASEGLRVTIDYLRSGAIGDLQEAHIWTNRPIWRQAHQVPTGSEPTPKNLDWEAWIGPAAMRPFRHEPADGWGGLYHPFNWRAFWDFGCGALGDMACHEIDPLYWALNPGYPTSVELVDTEPMKGPVAFQSEGTVRYEFPANDGRKPFTLYWYEGGRKPARPEELEEGTELTNEGALYIGSKCKMIAMPMARSAPRLLPQSAHDEFGTPEQKIERSEGHHKEWYSACIGEKPYDYPRGNFYYSGPFTEVVLLGCIAQRVGGKLEYDAEKSEITNNSEANALMTKEYRKGWDFRMG